MRRVLSLCSAALLVVALAACGDDDAATTPPVDQPAPTDAPDPAGDDATTDDDDGNGDSADDASGDTPGAAAPGAAGTVVIDGVSYAMDRALLCDPDAAPDVPGLDQLLELQAFDSAGNQLDLNISEFGGFPSNDITWVGPEGVYASYYSDFGGGWEGDAGDFVDGPPITVDGGRATGSALLADAFSFDLEGEIEDIVEITFDIVVPTETFACR